MAKPFSVQCPNCEARLKIQNPKAIGKKVRCPNCENPFTVRGPKPSAPPKDDFDLGDDDDDYGDSFDDYEEEYERDEYERDDFGPPRRSSRKSSPSRSRSSRVGGRSSSRGKKSPRKKSKNNQAPLIIGGAVLAFLLLLGLGFFIYQLAGGGGAKVDFAWLPPDSQMVVSIDVDEVWNAGVTQRGLNNPESKNAKRDIERMMEKIGFADGESPDVIDRITMGMTDPDRGDGLAVIVKKTAWDVDSHVQKANLSKAEHDGKTIYEDRRMAFHFADDKTLIVGQKEVVKAAISRGADSKLGEKFSFLPRGQIVVGFLPNNHEELTREIQPNPMIGAMLGGKTYINDILEGLKEMRGGALAFDLGGGIEVEVVAKCSNSDAAGKLSGGIDNLLADARKEIDNNRGNVGQFGKQAEEAFAIAETIFNTLDASRSGENVSLTLEISSSVIDKAEALAKQNPGGAGGMPGIPGFDVDDLFKGFGGMGGPPPGFGGPPPGFGGPGNRRPPAPGTSLNPFANARDAARRAEDKNNLHQIGLAFHNYHDVHRSFPLGKNQQNPERGSGLSWRVHILPYLEQGPLYSQFNLDEPWDSEHNKRLIAQMPQVYARPGANLGPGKTTYVGLDGPGGVAIGNGGGTRMSDIIDGSSNTILVAEVKDEHAVTWTKPEDYKYDQNDPGKKLGGWAGGFHALFCDGHVEFISESMIATELLKRFQMNDRQPLSFD